MGHDGNEDVRALMRMSRRAAGLTQRQLADSAGVSIGVIRDIEQGRTRHLQTRSAEAIVSALGLDGRSARQFTRAACGANSSGTSMQRYARAADRQAPGAGTTPAAGPDEAHRLFLRVLGPVTAHRGATELQLGTPSQRAVLALLALSPGELVSRETLIDALWGEMPPASAVKQVQKYAGRLRRILDPGGLAQDPSGTLARVGSGYRLRVGPARLDLLMFRDLAGRAQAARTAGNYDTACSLLEQACGLWHGDPAADVSILQGHPAVTGLAGQRIAAMIALAQIACSAGWYDRALAHLTWVARREPLHEQAHALLMIALAGNGQQAAALREFGDLRRRLDEQLGARPCADLADAYQRVLHGDIRAASRSPRTGPGSLAPAERAASQVLLRELPTPVRHVTRRAADEPGTEPEPQLGGPHQQIPAVDTALAVPDLVSLGHAPAEPVPAGLLADATAAAPSPVPRQLPGMAVGFTGRAAELAALDAMLEEVGSGRPGTMVISAIGGTAGVGKTALAVHWAHRRAGRFPGGQLWVNLRGFAPSARPVSPSEAIRGFLDALGVPAERVPPDLGAQAGLYRSLLADRNVLILLDNARDEEQVRPLLASGPGCLTIVTSRNQLTGLAAAEGARLLSLDVLTHDEACHMLTARLGGGRADEDPDAVAQIAGLCARLPLALAIAAAAAAARPRLPTAALAAELRGAASPLDALDTGDPATSIRAVFSWSHSQLSPAAARMFRLLALHPGPDISPPAAASLAGTGEPDARRLLAELARAHLIAEHAAGRYAFHDLLRAYGIELAGACEGQDEQQAAVTRLLDHYLQAASAAMDLLSPAECDRRPRIPTAGAPQAFLDKDQAREWLRTELANMVAAIAYAADHEWPQHAIWLAGIIFRFLEMTGHYPEIVTVSTCCLRAARHAADRTAEAEALNNLAAVYLRQGRYRSGTETLQQALSLYEETGDGLGQARALGNLGIVEFQQGHFQQAVSYQERALTRYRKIGNTSGEARALNNLSLVLLRQGRYQQAADGFRLALTLRLDPDTEIYCLANLGVSLLRQGDSQAVSYLVRALDLSRRAGHLASEAYCLINLGLADLHEGRYQEAADHLHRAEALGREQGDPDCEADALNGLGELALITGHPATARDQHARALDLANQAGAKQEQGRAHQGLAAACQADGDHKAALHHRQQARLIYASLGM